MFVVLQVLQQEQNGIFFKLKGILSKPKVTARTQTLLDSPYMLLTAIDNGKGLDWEEIQWAAREHSRHILLPDGISLPAGSFLRAFSSHAFDLQVLVHTACELIRQTRMPMYRRMLGLIDEEGKYVQILPELLKHYTSVKVLTRNTALYQQAGEDMMHQLGAPVLLTNTLAGFGDCVLALCPGSFRSEEDTRLTCPVLSTGSCKLRYTPEEFHGLAVSPPPYHEPIPQGVSAHLLLAALHDLSGVTSTGYIASSLLYNHKYSSLQEAVRAVSMMAGFAYTEPY